MAFDLVGRDLAHFNLTRPLGSGAMSEVYLAVDSRLEREVAVKVILDSVARKPALVERFEREARAAGRLEHPNVARVYYFGQTTDEAPFYAMEFVDGWSLGDVVEARVRIRIDQLLALLAQCCAGLQAAHDAGIVHRDIKPANLMVNHLGLLKIVDFGLAKLSDDKSMTRTGTMLGTPYYMAPEIVRGEGGDWRSDIYSLGVTFYHLLTGSPPYEADTPYGVMMRHINHPVPDLAKANPSLPPGLCSLVTSMLLKAPEQRPSSYKLLQRSAMQLASELSQKELATELRWCSFESQNTVGERGRCQSCQRSYGRAERSARFHVDLVGWHRNGAEEAMAAYIGRAVGNPPDMVAPLLKNLPFRASFKAPRERAKRMQRAFFKMGADVELVPVVEQSGGLGKDDLKELPFRPYWPPEPEPEGDEEQSSKASSRDTRSLLTGVRVRSRRPSGGTLAIGGLGALVILLGGALLVERSRRSKPPPTEVTSQTLPLAPIAVATDETPESTKGGSAWDGSFGEEPAISVDVANEPPDAPPKESVPPPALPPEPGLESKAFEITLPTGVDRATAQGALRVLEAQAEEINGLLGLKSSVVSLRFTTDAHVDAEGSRLWPHAASVPDLEFPLGGAGGPEEGSFIPAARLLYGRSALHRASNATLPPHLIVGFSLVLEQGERAPSSVADLVAEGQDTTPSQLDVVLGSNPARTERLLHSYCGWIISEQGWRKVGRMLEALERSGDVELSFIQAFGQSPGEIEMEWTAATTGVE